MVFVFPGQGSYHYPILRELYEGYAEARSDFELADETCRRFFGIGFLPLVTAADQAKHDSVLNSFPDLDQIGIYLTEVTLAELLVRRGLRPSLTAGHSFGDLAALTTAGVFDKRCGLKIVCQRVLALQALTVEGRMAAVSSNAERTRELIEQLGVCSLEISVINHPGQTVVSGHLAELEAVRNLAASKGVSVTILKSRYPFHSSLLERAVNLFRTNLRSYQFQAPSIPVYICTERRLVSPDCDVPDVLSKQFIKRLDFLGLVNDLAHQGCSYFVECGAGDTVSKLLAKNIPETQDIVVEPAAGRGVRADEQIFSARERKLSKPSPSADPGKLIGELETKIREAAELIHRTRAALRNPYASSAGNGRR
jgi:acyl transferase domain-containing protein